MAPSNSTSADNAQTSNNPRTTSISSLPLETTTNTPPTAMPTSNTANHALTPALPPLPNITIFWKLPYLTLPVRSPACVRNAFGIKRIVDVAAAARIRVPERHQRLRFDPRLCRSLAAFRNRIRSMYDCEVLGMDISSLSMIMHEPRSERIGLHHVNGRSWEDTLRVFEDRRWCRFDVHVEFDALGQLIWEDERVGGKRERERERDGQEGGERVVKKQKVVEQNNIGEGQKVLEEQQVIEKPDVTEKPKVIKEHEAAKEGKTAEPSSESDKVENKMIAKVETTVCSR